MTLLVPALVALVLAAIPAALFGKNLNLFCVSLDTPAGSAESDAEPADTSMPAISVLVPARDEERGMGDTLRAVLASRNVDLEVIVLDDHSTDATAEIVLQIAGQDARVRYLASAALPANWNGKQHACWQLAQAATLDRFVFLDADVRLHPEGLSRLAAYHDRSGVALLSAFPRQITVTWLEKWLIPMMHFILLGFLPFARMRSSAHPAYAAGCGQLFMTYRDAYQQAGTHASIADSRHDGVKLPRAYRTAGLMSDVIDGGEIAACRMYRSAGQVIRGVLKNADEGIANPKLIVPFTVMLLGGTVLPILWVIRLGFAEGSTWRGLSVGLTVLAIVLGHLPRALAASRFRQPWSGVVFHSLAVSLFVALQWIALVNSWLGRQVAWRGRTEAHNAPTT